MNNFLLNCFTISEIITALLYLVGAFCLWRIERMPYLIRLSLLCPLLVTSIIYLIIPFFHQDTIRQTALLQISHLALVGSIITNYGVYEYGRLKKVV